MKYRIAAALFLSLASPALSQTARPPDAAPPAYVPWEVDQQSAQLLMNQLGEIPAKWSMPLINYLNHQQEVAQALWRAKAEAEKTKAARKPETP